MIATAVQFYDVVLFFHISAMVLAFGPTFAYGLFLVVAQRDGGVAIPSVGRAMMTWDRIAGTLGMTVILISGIYLVSDGPYEASEFFVSWGFVAIIALFGVSHGYFAPKTRRIVELAERDLEAGAGKEMSGQFNALSQQVAKVGGAAGLLVILTIYVMTAKPFL